MSKPMKDLKPFYMTDDGISYTVLVYKSVHKEDDWMVVIREDRYKNKYMRLSGNDPEEVAKKAFNRFVCLKMLNLKIGEIKCLT